MGKRLSNTYWLVDQSEWRPVKAVLQPSQNKSDGRTAAEVKGAPQLYDGLVTTSKDAQENDPHKKDNYGHEKFLEAGKKLLTTKLAMK